MKMVQKFIEEKVKKIKEEVGDGRAVVAASGGVDSAVCAILSHQALGSRLTAVFIDDGLMREGEPEAVVKLLKKLGLQVKLVRAERRFFKVLKGVEDPEKKRKVFRDIFYKILGEVVREAKAGYLVQGTIAADVAETKGGIKTQHNVLKQIGVDSGKYGLEILEPLEDIYKPEVRRVGKALGLPKEAWERMPFPGPGLATRVVGEVTPRRVKIVRRATQIIEKELGSLKSFQYLAVLLKDQATGLKKGKRVLGEIVALRAVDSKDAMTASVTKIPWKKLMRIQRKITAEIPSVVKVVFDVTPKPPSTIEWV